MSGQENVEDVPRPSQVPKVELSEKACLACELGSAESDKWLKNWPESQQADILEKVKEYERCESMRCEQSHALLASTQPLVQQQARGGEGCGCTRVLYQTDFAGGATVVIGSVDYPAGKYCLGEDINFEAPADFALAIQILANNVTIDLCGFTLNQTNDFLAGAIRIGDVDLPFKNIIVKNGNITNFKLHGVRGRIASPENVMESLTFSDLNILGCGTNRSGFVGGTGILLFGVPANNGNLIPSFRNVTISNCKVNSNLGDYAAVTVVGGDNVVISDTQANNRSTTIQGSNWFLAYWIIYSTNVKMFNCHGNGVSSTEQAVTILSGPASIFGNYNLHIKDCQFNLGYSYASRLVATVLSNNVNMLVENCQFNNNRAGAGFNRGIICGANLDGTRDARIVNCQFNGITGGSNAFILGMNSTNVVNLVVENSQSCNNGAPGASYVSGFTVSSEPSAQNVTLRNCVASDLFSDGFGSATFGFDLNSFNALDSVNHVLKDCIAERIRGTFFVAGIVRGTFFGGQSSPALHRNLLIQNCRVSDVRSEIAGSVFTAGIRIDNELSPVLLDNIVSDCIRGILFATSGEGYVEKGLVKHNEVSNCTLAGFVDQRLPETSSAWIDNTACFNGAVEGGSHAENYIINWKCPKHRPISEGSLTCYPKTSKKAYNLSITQ